MAEVPSDYEALKLRVRDLEHALNQRNDTLALAYKLSPTHLKLMGLLLSLPTVTPTMIVQRLNITTDAKVAIHRLRVHLKRWSITVHNKRGLGYWLDDEDKAKIREAIKKASDGQDGLVEPSPTPPPVSGGTALATFSI